MFQSEDYDLYQDIQTRTNGELFLGVVGPVRTGKSTFIRRFMSQAMIPGMAAESQTMTTDELPVSGKGTLITTVEPKFVPKEAVRLKMSEQVQIQVRLIDCVGFVVDGATGIYDNENERMVKTPWFEEEIPFTKAAGIGTEKVIKDHATVGIVLTCDGSFGEIGREQFVPAEERTVAQLKEIGKPFICIINTVNPYGEAVCELAETMSEKYGVTCLPVDCDHMQADTVHRIMQAILYAFPVTAVNFFMPGWISMLDENHALKQTMVACAKTYMQQIMTMKDIEKNRTLLQNPYVERCTIEEVHMDTGVVVIRLDFVKNDYYAMLSEMLGSEVHGEYELFDLLCDLAKKRQEVDKIAEAMQEVSQKGYGAVMPGRDEIKLEEPELVRHGSKYGVNIRASAPSVHMINAEIETEIAPIVGTQQQAQDLIDYIKAAQTDTNQASIWDTLIFGKTMGELVDEGMKVKISKMTEECQEKMQETLKKIMNESNGNVIFVII